MVPIHNEFVRDDVINCGTISLPTVVLKALEKIVLTTLLEHLEYNNAIASDSAASRKNDPIPLAF